MVEWWHDAVDTARHVVMFLGEDQKFTNDNNAHQYLGIKYGHSNFDGKKYFIVETI